METTTPLVLTQYGLMAKKHWKEFCPNLVRDLESRGELQQMLFEAQERTQEEMVDLVWKLIREQKYTAEQAYHTAWEMVREKYIFIQPEEAS